MCQKETFLGPPDKEVPPSSIYPMNYLTFLAFAISGLYLCFAQLQSDDAKGRGCGCDSGQVFPFPAYDCEDIHPDGPVATATITVVQNSLTTETCLITDVNTVLTIATSIQTVSGCPRITISVVQSTTSTTTSATTTSFTSTTAVQTSFTTSTSTFVSTFYTYTKPCHHGHHCGENPRRRCRTCAPMTTAIQGPVEETVYSYEDDD